MSAPDEPAGPVGFALHRPAGRARTRVDGAPPVVCAVLVLALLVLPFFAYPIFLMKALCFALFAGAFNLLLGYGGLMSFGHAAYFGFAGYVSTYATKVWGLTPELAIVAGTCAAALMGLVFGAIAIRRQGIYFAMITLALAQLLYFICLQSDFTGGEDGIQGVPRRALLGLVPLKDDLVLYFVVLAIFLVGMFAIYRIIHSPFGHVLRMIRDNEPRAISLGYRAPQYKLVVFVLSTALAGLAGATKGIVFQLASLTDVHWSMSGEVVLMTLVGGMGTILGPVVGAAIMIGIESYFAHIGGWITVLQGTIFILCVVLFPAGIVGVIQTWFKGARSA